MWALVAAVRHRPPDRVQFVGLAVLEVALLALTVLALVAVGGGERPGEPGAFFGYLVTLVCLPPLAWVLARMEPTRWGSAIVCAVCLVTAGGRGPAPADLGGARWLTPRTAHRAARHRTPARAGC